MRYSKDYYQEDVVVATTKITGFLTREVVPCAVSDKDLLIKKLCDVLLDRLERPSVPYKKQSECTLKSSDCGGKPGVKSSAVIPVIAVR